MVIFARNLWLFGLAIVLGVLAWVVPGDRVETRSVDPLIAGFDSQAIRRVTVLEGDDVRVTLELDAPSSAWRIDELFHAPAFGLRIDSLLSRIGAMTTLDLVGDGPDSPAEFGLLSDDAVGVRLAAGEGEGAPDVSLRFAPATDGAVFVNVEGQARVYRVARFPMPATAPLSWFDDRSVAPLEELQVTKIEASGPALGGPVTIARPPRVFDGRFLDAEGRALSREGVVEVLTRLRSLFPVDVLGEVADGDAGVEDVALRLEVTPSIGVPFVVVMAPLVEAAPEPGGTPARWRAFRVGSSFTVALREDAVVGLVAALESAARSAR